MQMKVHESADKEALRVFKDALALGQALALTADNPCDDALQQL